MNIVSSVHEGFHNVPTLYGSKVREGPKVANFSQGLKEAGKGLFYGYYDGITGLVREPMEGAKKEGFLGAIKGAGRSFVNVTMKPAAGILGLVVHPTQGAWKSMQKTWAKEQEQHQRNVRLSDGAFEVKCSNALDRNAILEKFETAKMTTNVRQKTYKGLAEKEMYGSHVVNMTALGEQTTDSEYEDAIFERDLHLAKQLSIAGEK